jgi:hypothetical protein
MNTSARPQGAPLAIFAAFLTVLVVIALAPTERAQAAEQDGLKLEGVETPWFTDFGWLRATYGRIARFELTNTGTEQVTDITVVPEAPFTHEHSEFYCDGHQLDPGYRCDLYIGFMPTEAGTFERTITVTTAQGRSVSIAVIGRAWPEDGTRPPDPTPTPDTDPPIVDRYYVDGVSRISPDGKRLYAWLFHDGHDAGGVPLDNRGLGDWQVESRVVGGTWAERLDENGTQYFPTGPAQARTRVQDLAGNWSDWKVLDINFTLDDASRSTANRVLAQTWKGSWTKRTTSGPYRRTVETTQTKGASSRIRTRGRHYALVARRTSDGGSIAIYVNGKKDREVSLRSPTGTTQDRLIVWQRRFDSSATRTVEVRVLERPANKRKVQLDAWIVRR